MKLLILVFSEENIQRKLVGATRNLAIYEHISSILLKEYSIARTGKQCREKTKKLLADFLKQKTTTGGVAMIVRNAKFTK